jgi:3-hydroxybutyryl-CoA dehydrogenase
VDERIAIAGGGAVACGLAAAAARHGPVVLLARSLDSAERARAGVERALARQEVELDPAHLEVVTDSRALAGATFAVEAVVEDLEIKTRLFEELGPILERKAILATTTSSLSVEQLAQASGRPERFLGLHVFNPVTRMELVELIFPAAATGETRKRAVALCEALEKTPVEVPDVPGFVVNRLLFPYLFSAVRLLEETRMDPRDIDTCMRLGAGHPMGPLALLDLIGLDVSAAIGRSMGEPVPAHLDVLIAEGALGRKSGRGFHAY